MGLGGSHPPAAAEWAQPSRRKERAMSSYGLGLTRTLPAANFSKGSLSLQGDIARCMIRACE